MYSLFIENNVEVNVLIQKANLMQIPNRDNDKDDCWC